MIWTDIPRRPRLLEEGADWITFTSSTRRSSIFSRPVQLARARRPEFPEKCAWLRSAPRRRKRFGEALGLTNPLRGQTAYDRRHGQGGGGRKAKRSNAKVEGRMAPASAALPLPMARVESPAVGTALPAPPRDPEPRPDPGWDNPGSLEARTQAPVPAPVATNSKHSCKVLATRAG